MASDTYLECRVEDIKATSANALTTGPFGSAISSRFFGSHGVPVIRGSNLSQDIGLRLVEHDIVFIATEKAQEFSRSFAFPGDLIFTCWGTIDQVGLIDHRAKHTHYIISNKQMKLTPDSAKADSLYLYYLFSSPLVRTSILNQGIGSSVPGFNLGQLRNIRLRLPPLGHQKAIAHILGSLDDKIELNRRMNETLEAMARALFKSWFIDFDPVRAKADGRKPEGMDDATASLFPDSFEESELGPIPYGWNTIPILETADLLSGGTPSTSNPSYWDGPIPWASAKDVSQCGEAFLISTERSITTSGLANSATKVIPRLSTVVVARGATTGRFAMFGNDIAMNQTCYALRDRQSLHFYMNRVFAELVAQLVHSAHGSVFDTITTETFRRGVIIAPVLELRRHFNDTVSPLFTKLLNNLVESRTLASLRDSLLPKLLSGELRVNDAERFVEAAS